MFEFLKKKRKQEPNLELAADNPDDAHNDLKKQPSLEDIPLPPKPESSTVQTDKKEVSSIPVPTPEKEEDFDFNLPDFDEDENVKDLPVPPSTEDKDKKNMHNEVPGLEALENMDLEDEFVEATGGETNTETENVQEQTGNIKADKIVIENANTTPSNPSSLNQINDSTNNTSSAANTVSTSINTADDLSKSLSEPTTLEEPKNSISQKEINSEDQKIAEPTELELPTEEDANNQNQEDEKTKDLPEYIPDENEPEITPITQQVEPKSEKQEIEVKGDQYLELDKCKMIFENVYEATQTIKIVVDEEKKVENTKKTIVSQLKIAHDEMDMMQEKLMKIDNILFER